MEWINIWYFTCEVWIFLFRFEGRRALSLYIKIRMSIECRQRSYSSINQIWKKLPNDNFIITMEKKSSYTWKNLIYLHFINNFWQQCLLLNSTYRPSISLCSISQTGYKYYARFPFHIYQKFVTWMLHVYYFAFYPYIMAFNFHL